MCARKPSALARRIEAGEGTADGLDSDSASAALLTTLLPDFSSCEWAYLAGFRDVITAAIQEIEGNPKLVQEARS